MDGLLGRAAADGVPHCEGRRLASRGGGRGGRKSWLGGLGDWRGTAPKVPAGIRRERVREAEVRGFGGRQAGRQADWREPTDSEIRA